MHILRNEKIDGQYPLPNLWNGSDTEPLPEGYIKCPDKFCSAFFPKGKLGGGFVDLEIENGTVVSAVWNEENYKNFFEIHGEPPMITYLFDKIADYYNMGVDSIG